MPMKILIACEESQVVTIEFRKLGYHAFSCDIKPCSGNHPEWHIQTDVLNIIDLGWDLVIAFPPCTHISASGARHFKDKKEDGRQQEAIDFFMAISNSPCEYIAIENPVGIMSTVWRKPDQIIQPWQFGDSFQKKTCLWLKNLPLLEPTKIVDKGEFVITNFGKRFPKWYARHRDSTVRSRTFPGIAKAMANQWGGMLNGSYISRHE